jgi:hypothetical protein
MPSLVLTLGIFLNSHVVAGPYNVDGSPGIALALEFGFTPGAKPAVCTVSPSNSIVDVVAAITGDVRGAPDRIEHAASRNKRGSYKNSGYANTFCWPEKTADWRAFTGRVEK